MAGNLIDAPGAMTPDYVAELLSIIPAKAAATRRRFITIIVDGDVCFDVMHALRATDAPNPWTGGQA